jgi:hypothetical protein
MSLDRGTFSDRGMGGTAPTALRSRLFVSDTAPDRKPVEALDEWTAETGGGVAATRSLVSISRDLDQYAEEFAQRLRPIPTGFDMLDHWIGKGLRQGELLLLGGAPGVGKTTFCLQIARNIAASGHANVLYACYEHPEEYVLNRLLVQETVDPGAPPAEGSGLTLEELQRLSAEIALTNPGGGFYETLRSHPAGARATLAVDEYAGRFHLVANAACLLGTGVVGRLGPRGLARILIPATVLCSVAVGFLALAAGHTPTAAGLLAISGLGAGVLQVVGPAQAVDAVDAEERGDAIAATGTFRSTALLGSPLIVAGMLGIAALGPAMLAAGGVMLAPTIMATWFARRTRRAASSPTPAPEPSSLIDRPSGPGQ